MNFQFYISVSPGDTSPIDALHKDILDIETEAVVTGAEAQRETQCKAENLCVIIDSELTSRT